jgi:AGCS family alanine or glycine:cation symporter
MAAIEAWLGAVNAVVWGPPMLVLLVGTHIFLTIRLRFIQRHLGRAIRLSLQRAPEGKGDVSQYGALATSLAACIGTGIIVGVATAIAAGGPGAVLWMWLTGVLGFATKYGEALLAVKYRVTLPDGGMAGGPMYVLERAHESPVRQPRSRSDRSGAGGRPSPKARAGAGRRSSTDRGIHHRSEGTC